MTIYIGGTLASMLFAWVATHLIKNRNYYKNQNFFYSSLLFKFFAVLSFLPLAVISAVRYEVGTDFLTYRSIYLSNATRYENQEPLFALFVRVVHLISEQPQAFFFASSFVIVASYYFCFFKCSRNPIFSIFLFVFSVDYFRSMNGVRQYLAVAITLFSLLQIEKRRWMSAIFLIIGAYFMHNSAIIFFAFFILAKLHPEPKYLFAFITILAILMQAVKEYVLPFIQRYTTYGRYFDANSFYSVSDARLYSLLILLCFFALAFYVYYFQGEKQSNQLKMLFYSSFLGTVLYLFTAVFPSNFGRLAYYFEAIIIVYAPGVVQLIKNRAVRLSIISVMIIGYIAKTIYTLLYMGYQDVLPYQTFWNSVL